MQQRALNLIERCTQRNDIDQTSFCYASIQAGRRRRLPCLGGSIGSDRRRHQLRIDGTPGRVCARASDTHGRPGHAAYGSSWSEPRDRSMRSGWGVGVLTSRQSHDGCGRRSGLHSRSTSSTTTVNQLDPSIGRSSFNSFASLDTLRRTVNLCWRLAVRYSISQLIPPAPLLLKRLTL